MVVSTSDGAETSEKITSSALLTPNEVSEGDSEEEEKDTSGKHRSHAASQEPQKVSLPSLALDGGSAATVILASTPPRVKGGGGGMMVHQTEHNGGKARGGGSSDGETSPEALTADSESKRSSQRWRQHLITSVASTSTDQLVRDDDASVDNDDSENEKREDALNASLPKIERGGDTIKQLFAQRQREISPSPPSSSPSPSAPPRSLSASLVSSSSSLACYGHAADHTLPMHEDNDDGNRGNRNQTRGKEGDVVEPGDTKTAHRAGIHRSPPSGVGSSSDPHAPPQPASADADTPPPPLARLREPQQQAGDPRNAPFLFHSTETAGAENATSHRHSDDFSLHGESTQLSASQQTGSSASSAPPGLPRLLPENDATSADTTAAQDTDSLRQLWHSTSPSPQPKSLTVFPPTDPSAVSSRPSAGMQAQMNGLQQRQQRQQHAPSSSGHLFMHGSVSRTRSPSNAGTRPSYGWLKKVSSTGAEASAAGADARGPAAKHLPHLSTWPATASVFPAHPLPSQQREHQQQHQLLQGPHHPLASSYSTPPETWEREKKEKSGSRSPLHLRQREPPAWRSPQPAHFPISLNVSPASLRTYTAVNNNNMSTAEQSDKERNLSASFPSASQTTALLELPSSADAPLTEANVVLGRCVRGRSNSSASSSASTAVLTQTFTQASADRRPSPPNTSALFPPTAAAAAATATTATPLRKPACAAGASVSAGGSPGQSLTRSRPSTQLITKAAATRPTASPATMWICLDDDDDDDEDEDEEEVVEHDDDEEAVAKDAKHAVKGGSSSNVAAADVGKGAAVTGVHQHSAPPPHEREKTVTGRDAGIVVMEQQQQQQRKPSPSRRRPAERSHPISEILSPTFRQRRRPTQSFSSPDSIHREGERSHEKSASTVRVGGEAAPRSADGAHASVKDPRGLYIRLDDESDEEEEESEEHKEGGKTDVPPHKSPRLSNASASVVESPVRRVVTPASENAAQSPVGASPGLAKRENHSSALLILDDDDDDDDVEEVERRKRDLLARQDGAKQHTSGGARHASSQRLSILSSESDNSQDIGAPKPMVKDLFFPERLDPEVRPCSPFYESIHAYQQHYQQQQEEEKGKTGKVLSAGPSAAVTAAVSSSSSPRVTGKNGVKGERQAATSVRASTGQKRSRVRASLVPALPDWGRPADTLLRDFFPAKFTRRSFTEAAERVMSPLHFLEPNDFWAAFSSAVFVGEGSFGLVWRCRTVDGDLVAVKSCPINLRTRANIEDSFSTIREIATMRFLNEMQVPYVLPLHSAFYVRAAEALPPLAQEALEWRQRLRKQAEAAVLEREVELLGRGHVALSKRGRNGGSSGVAVSAFEQQVALELARQALSETSAERAERARLQGVRLPRFLSITEDDLRQSDATAFLVMELCDGDVEDIPRSDGVAKGVVFCISSALAAMHELGLLHLDLKPSNVLFAYEHGPSQASPSGGGDGGGVLTPSPARTMDAVKFYLSDFGNCRLVGPAPLAEVTESFGTFEYMDLRALQDAVCGRPTDAFSLGATLYELLYGKRLYPKCSNPKCAEEADHTRACFVEAARRPVVLPPSTSTNTNVPGRATANRSATAITATAFSGLSPSAHEEDKKSAPQQGDVSEKSAKSGTSASPALTPLQSLTLALLQGKWAERMTAAECRRFLIDTFHITQGDEVVDGCVENEEREREREEGG